MSDKQKPPLKQKHRYIAHTSLFFISLLCLMVCFSTLSHAEQNLELIPEPSGFSFGLTDCLENTDNTPPLQKGLVLYQDGEPLNGSGLGFGVPIVKVQGKWFYSGSARVQPGEAYNEYEKIFYMDTYREDLDDQIHYIQERSVARIIVKYTLQEDRIRVLLDMSSVQSRYENLLVLNEQSGRIFTVYRGSNLETVSYRNFNWVEINNNCGSFYSSDAGYFLTEDRRLGFGIACRHSARLVRSRDVSQDKDLAGLQFELLGGLSSFYYQIYLDTPINTPTWWE